MTDVSRVRDLRYALGQAGPPPPPAASTSSRSERIAAVASGIGPETDAVEVVLVTDEADEDPPFLVLLTVWDGTSMMAAHAALGAAAAGRVSDAIQEAISRGAAVGVPERQEQ